MLLNPDGLYYRYIRKSREDIEAEKHGEGETLARHEKILDDLADRLNIRIEKTYKEIVSGETIAARPLMMQMLQDIEINRPDGVLVVEVERLARGNTRDQGLVAETFKYSGTKIITPMKTFDPNNESDEEYFEFGLFMSRREYATTRRRLRSGKYSAASEGKWPWSKSPYGYERYKLKNQKGYSLQINQSEANVVKLIYQLYTTGTPLTSNIPISCSRIAILLNQMHIPTRENKEWGNGVVRDIIMNKVYIGYVPAGKRKLVKAMKDGQIVRSTPLSKDFKYYKGLHEPIVDEDMFEEAQQTFKQRSKTPAFLDGKIKNPLAGILRCKNCGYTLIRRPGNAREKNDWFLCNHCDMPGASVDDVMDNLYNALENWLSDYNISLEAKHVSQVVGSAVIESQLHEAENTLAGLQTRLEKAYDAFETGVYDADVFRERSQALTKLINKEKATLVTIQTQLDKQKQFELRKKLLVPKVEHLLAHRNEMNAEEQNIVLKEILEKVEYFKERKGTKLEIPKFHLEIFPRI